MPNNSGASTGQSRRRAFGVDVRTSLWLVLLSVGAVATSFAWQGEAGLNIADEGFLWYGAQRVMHGEVPQIDFMAYEPARYYWSAAIMSLMEDDGIIALRIAVAVLQVVGLFIALMLVASAQEKRDWPTLLLSLVVLLLWMYPRHKLFDTTISIALVAVLAWCLRSSSPVRYLLLGAFVGAATIVGRNHGLYGGMASIIGVAYLAFRGVERRWFRAFVQLAAGFVVVACCAVIYASTVQGWLPALWDSFLVVFEQGATNLPLPLPWPWRVPFAEHFDFETLRQLLIGAFFVGLLVVPVLGYYRAICESVARIATDSVGLAATFLAFPYAHYAFSRADLGHVALGVFPMLLLVITMLLRRSPYTRLATMGLLALISAIIMVPAQPGWQAWRAGTWQAVAVARDTLRVQPGLASLMGLLRALADQFAPEGRAVLIAPFWPGAYPLLDRRAPIWEIYATWPRDDAFQSKEIERLRAANPGLIVVVDVALDGREDLRFHNTHALFERYIRENFIRVEGLVKPDYIQVYRNAN